MWRHSHFRQGIRTIPLALVMVLGSGIDLSIAQAQSLQVGVQEGPYYVGEPVVVQVLVKDVSGKSEPQCRLESPVPDGVTLEGPEVGTSTSSFTQILNGRMTQHESTSYRFNYVVTSTREGKITLGQFVVEVEGETHTLEGPELTFETLASDTAMRIEVSLSKSVMYVGEQIPVKIRWSFAGDLDEVRYAFSHLQVRSPFFDQFTFLDDEADETEGTRLPLVTAKGTIRIGATAKQEIEQGEGRIVVTAERTLVPDRAGEYRDIPIVCRTEKVIRWGRDIFGRLSAQRTAPARAVGTPLTLTVRSLPEAGRPASFAGAVGEGFSLEVSANRSVVRRGDPIELTLQIAGKGNVGQSSLPPLSADDGLSEKQFQLPSESPAGSFDGERKQFNVTIRVKDEQVSQIPALALSWFDPVLEKYQTTRSKPIALQVLPTQIVTADDVVAPAAVSKGGESSSKETAESGPRASSTSAAFAGANLAVERDPQILLKNVASGWTRREFRWTMYTLGCGSLILGVWWRRHVESVKAIHPLKQSGKEWIRRLREASSLPANTKAHAVVQVLHELLPQVADARSRSEINDILAECDNQRYAPTGVSTAMPQSGSAELNEHESKMELADRAERLVERIVASCDPSHKRKTG